MASPQGSPTPDHQSQAPRDDSAANRDDQDPERAGLLGYTRILDRRPTSLELRLGILAFWFLCLSSIGFGLFAGEQAKFHGSEPSGDRPIEVVTTTIFLSPTNSPSPPHKSGNVCSSGPCVEVAGDLRRVFQWSSNPCEDFAEFSTARTRKAASDVISTEIDQVINATLSAESINPVIQKLHFFKSLCSIKTKNVSYSEFHPILHRVSTLLLRSKSRSKDNSFGAVLAYLHSASIPAFFKATAANYHFTLNPQIVSLEGIEDAFTSLYPTNEVSHRIAGVKILVSILSTLVDNSQETTSITIDELQDFACAQPRVTCWIHWKDFYSALDPGKAIRLLHVRGIDYFSHLGRILDEQPGVVLESYFHWVTILTISKKSCQEELKVNFGPSLVKTLFLTSEKQLSDWRNRTRSAEFFIQSVLNLSPNSSLPRRIETPSIDENQEEELSAIIRNRWVDTAFKLARIKTRKEFSQGQAYWNMMGTELQIVGDKLYFPLGSLQPPIFYWSLDDLPKSLSFGSLGFKLFLEFRKLQENSYSDFDKTCAFSLSRAFELWKKYRIENPNESKKRLVGLIDEISDSDQFFYLAFGRLGLICPEIIENSDFIRAFNCSISKQKS